MWTTKKSNLIEHLGRIRFYYIVGLYTIGLLFFLFSKLPFTWWVFLTMILIATVNEPGAMIHRSAHRIKGTVLALLFISPLLYILKLNYRFVPITMILSAVCLAASSANAKRYDIYVFFMTITVFLLSAQINSISMNFGLLQMMASRFFSTLIAIMIVIAGDYFLFGSFKYAQKSCLLQQILVNEWLEKSVTRIYATDRNQDNVFLFTTHLRREFNSNYDSLLGSIDSLRADFKSSELMLNRLKQYEATLWELRKLVFSLCFTILILRSKESTQHQLRHFYQLIQQAKSLQVGDVPTMLASTLVGESLPFI